MPSNDDQTSFECSSESFSFSASDESGSTFSNFVDLSPKTQKTHFEKFNLCGLSSEEYVKRIQSSFALYKAITQQDEGKKSVYQPFLHRNLRYVKHGRQMSSFQTNSDVMELKSTESCSYSRNFFEKKANLSLLVKLLKMAKNGEKHYKRFNKAKRLKHLTEEHFENFRKTKQFPTMFLIIRKITDETPVLKPAKILFFIDSKRHLKFSPFNSSRFNQPIMINDPHSKIVIDLSETFRNASLRNSFYVHLCFEKISKDNTWESMWSTIKIYTNNAVEINSAETSPDTERGRSNPKKHQINAEIIDSHLKLINFETNFKVISDKNYEDLCNNEFLIENSQHFSIDSYKLSKKLMDQKEKKALFAEYSHLAPIPLFPKFVKYRIFSGLEKSEEIFPSENHDETNQKNAIPKPNFVNSIMESMQCIICNKDLATLYHLLMHYHLSYPRLAFLLCTEKNQCKKTVKIEVYLDPSFRDVNELSRRCFSTGAYWIVHPYDSDILKQFYVINPNRFSQFNPDKSFIFNEDLMYSHQPVGNCLINDNRNILRSRDIWPMPNCDVQIRKSLKEVFDFVDVTYECKIFIATWNTLRLKIGIDRSYEIGLYNFFKLYLHIHQNFIKENGEKLKAHIAETIDYYASLKPEHGSINSFEKQMDLHMRLNRSDFDPLAPDSPAMLIFPFVFQDICNTALKSKRKVVHPLIKQNSERIKTKDDWRNLLIESVKQNLLPLNHELRLLTQEPHEIFRIFGLESIPPCLYELPYVPPAKDQEMVMMKHHGHGYLRSGWYLIPKTSSLPEGVEFMEAEPSGNHE